MSLLKDKTAEEIEELVVKMRGKLEKDERFVRDSELMKKSLEGFKVDLLNTQARQRQRFNVPYPTSLRTE